MADVSKAEKIASARKKLKLFQQKNKDAHTNNNRSTSSSLKSNSPIDSLYSIKESHPQDSIISENIDKNVSYQLQNDGDNCTHPEIFSFRTSTSNKSEIFFDEVIRKLSCSNDLGFNNEGKNVPDQVIDECNKVKCNNDNDLSTLNASLFDIFPGNKEDVQGTLSKLVELENQLALEKAANAKLQTKLMESHSHILSLQNEIKRLNENQSKKTADEVIELENKVKIHSQTIEILVSEKSELQKQLIILQDENDSNNRKCEELGSRLKASRSQVHKLEKELLDSNESKIQHNSIFKKMEDGIREKDLMISELSQQLLDAHNEIKELTKKVELETMNKLSLKKDSEEMEKQLSMAQIKLAQLGNENGSDLFQDFEKLKIDLESARKDAERAWEEGQRCETELKQYIENLNKQLSQANTKCKEMEKEKNDATLRVDSLVQHISDLEKQLQHERGLRDSMEESEAIKRLEKCLKEQENSLINKDIDMKNLITELREVKEKLNEAELWKDNMPDMVLLQQAMESDRVALTRAMEQNNSLKQKLQELEEYIIKLNNSKLELTEELDKYKHMAGEYRMHLEKYKSRQEMRMVDSVTQTISIIKSDSVAQTTYHDLSGNTNPHEPVSVEAMLMIEEKLRKTMDRIAELTDEKQRLEHLVLQLQGETETIGEYVTLYQNQRALLKQKAEERERQMMLITKEREELKGKLSEINSLLMRFPHNPEVEDTTCKISSLLGEIQFSSIVQEQVSSPPPTFHPCLLCSGKLINV